MPYATAQDFSTRYTAKRAKVLTNLADPEAKAKDAAVLNTALADATALMDAQLRKIFNEDAIAALKAANPVDPLLVRINCVFANRLMDNISPSEETLRQYEEAMTLLREIVSGEQCISLPEGVAVASKVLYTESERIFSDRNLECAGYWGALEGYS